MWHKSPGAEQVMLDMAVYRDFVAQCNNQEDNSKDRKQMLRILKKAMASELTDRQRLCLEEYFLRGRKMKDIAKSLNLSPSTVTRHIRRATEKLRHIAEYY